MENKEIIINVKDLLAEYIRKAWMIIVSMIIFAVLLGGYKYYSDRNSLGTNVNEDEYSFDEDSFSQTELEDIGQYVDLKKLYEEQKAYIENSVYINLNANQTHKAVLQYYIATETAEQARDLALVYYNYINKGGLVSDIYDVDKSLEMEYLQELLLGQGTNYDSNISSGVMNIQIYGVDDEAVTALTGKVKKQIEAFQKQALQDVSQHDLVLVDEAAGVYVDKNLYDSQSKVEEQLVAVKKSLSDAKGKLSEEQMLAANDILGENGIVEETDDETSNTVSISKKYILLGGILGFVLAVIVIYLIYFFDGTIKTVNEFTEYYGLNCFGVVRGKEKKFWDKLSERIFYSNEMKGYEQDLVVAKINVLCKNSEVHRVVLSVNQNVTSQKEIMEYAEGLKKLGIEAKITGDIFSDSSSICNLSKDENVILVEAIRKSTYENIRQKLLFCKKQEVHVLGCIAVS